MPLSLPRARTIADAPKRIQGPGRRFLAIVGLIGPPFPPIQDSGRSSWEPLGEQGGAAEAAKGPAAVAIDRVEQPLLRVIAHGDVVRP